MALDFIEDLSEFTMAEIDVAIRDYRRDPKSKFFPTPGQLRERASAERKHRAELDKLPPADLKPQFGESRPIMWWLQRRRFWKPHWREDDIPAEYRASYDASNARRMGEAA